MDPKIQNRVKELRVAREWTQEHLVLGVTVDERFLEHRRRSTSAGGIAAVVVAIGLFEYHLFRQHELRWELLAVGATAVVVKLAVLAWYRFNN
jgi:hypothetical protein